MKLQNKIISSLFAVTLLAGCGSQAVTTTTEVTEEPTETPVVEEVVTVDPVDVRVSAMKGPTAMGMVQMMSQVDAGEIDTNNYSFELLSAVDEIAPKIAKAEVDIAAVPANLGSVLYNNTDGSVVVLAVNTLGVLYICETGEAIQSFADLAGKTIYASGKGATPEYALMYLLEENGLTVDEDVTIEWKSEHAECVAALAQDPDGIALLPQPFVTAAQTKNDSIRVALDLTDEWDKVQENAETKSSLLTGIVIARKQFVEENPEAVEDFLTRYAESVEFTNTNIEEAATLIGDYDIIATPVAQKAIPECHIVCITGNEMKEALSGYLNVLYTQNPKAVGGNLPADDFYYGE